MKLIRLAENYFIVKNKKAFEKAFELYVPDFKNIAIIQFANQPTTYPSLICFNCISRTGNKLLVDANAVPLENIQSVNKVAIAAALLNSTFK